ncbi:MAG: tandem-95 repeat protein [Acidimicrobiia bacterium]
MAQQSGSWEGKPVRAFLIRVAAFALPLIFAIVVAWQLTRALPTPETWPGVIFWWLLVMASSTMALRIADRFAKRLMPLAVLMKLSLVFPDEAPNRFGVSLKSGNAHTLEELLERAERAGRHDDLTDAAETILALAAALNAHDPRTRGHGDRVRAYADMLGEEMGYTDEERNKLKWAAMLHDIGKLRVPAEVINSPGKLTDDEWKIMRNHPDWGMELAAPLLPWLGEFAAAIGQHHERFDGNGYPNGVAGEEIGLAARITSVADTYDVMTSVRSYKEARPASEAREELARCAGSQFDPVVVRAFLNISLGRQRWVAGPLSWLAQVPFFQSALQGATTLAQNAAVAAQTGLTATAIGATAVLAPALIDTPKPTVEEAALPAVVLEANDDVLTLAEDGSDTVFLLANDVAASLVSIVSGPSHGSAVLSAGGTLTYTPDPEFAGVDTITYQACNLDGDCVTAVLSITVTPVNDPPGLPVLPISLDEDTATTIDILGSVTDPDGDPAAASVTLVGVAAEGLILANGDGTFDYTPPPDFFGTDSFTVQICDEGGACELETLPVMVTPINDAPVVSVTPPAVVEDTPASIFVDASDVDGDVLVTSITSGPVSGSAIVDLDGSIFYTPGADFNGPESIEIEVCDATLCVTEAIAFSVAAVNDPPVVPGPGPLTTAEDTMVSFDPLAGAFDPEGGAVSLDSFDPVSAAGGTIVTGSLEYTPPANYVGIDTFTYAVADPEGATTSAVVTVTVTAENDIPVALDDGYSTNEDEPLSVAVPGLLVNDSDVDGDPLSAALESPAGSGAAVVNADGSFTYTPDPDFVGADSFTYRLDDGAGGLATATASIEVLPVNDAPDAFDDVESTLGPGAVNVAVLANDVDVEGDFDVSSVAVVVPPTKGTALAKPDGTVDYTPTEGEQGSDAFVYQICDLSALCDVATVTMGLMGPDAVDDAASMAEDSGPLTISATDNDTDPDANFDPTSAVVLTPAVSGTAVANGDGSFDYSPNPNFYGTDSFEYRVCDLAAACDVASVTISVTAVNDDPVAVDDGGVGFTTAEDTPFTTASVIGNDTDVEDGSPDASTVVVVGVTPPGLVNNGDGTFDYSPPGDSNGDVVFTYEVDDSVGATSNVASVTITVTAVNDDPVAVDDAPSVDEDTPAGVTFDVLANDTDVDPDTLSLDSYDGSGVTVGTLTDNGGGSFTYQAPDNYFGSQTFTYDVTDGLATDTGTVTITVNNVPDAPDTQDDAYSTQRDTALVEPAPGVLANDSDYDGDPLAAALASPPGNGMVVLNPDGSFTYTPDPGFVGSDSFSYTADDGLHPPVAANVNITVDDGIVMAGWFLGDSGSSPDTYDFVAVPPPLGNPDPDGDSDPGLTIKNSGGSESESDPLKYQHWLLVPTLAPVELNGPITLELWSTVEGFQTDKDIDVVVWVHDCDPAGVVCGPALLHYDVHHDNWNGGVADFVYHEIIAGSVSHTVAVGRSLRVRLQFDHQDVWVDMNSDHPSRVVFTEANRPPLTNPDAGVVLEDGGPVNINVLGNDSDPNLDSPSLAIDSAPGNGSALVVAGPTIDYDPDPDYFGSDSFTYRICDTSAACSVETVSITVTSVNDVPSFTVGPDETVLEDDGGQSVDPHPTAISPGPANESGQSTSFNVSNDNPALFKNAPTIDSGGKLEYEAWDDVSGSATVTVSISDDGGTADGGVDTSADQSFTITVTDVNDQPDFNDGSDVTVSEDAGPHTFSGWATAITAGVAQEEPPTQTLTFNVTANDNPALFSAGPTIDAVTGDLTFDTVGDAFGTANLTLTISDDGGTANGGVDTSDPQNFKITVDPVNDDPTANDDSYPLALIEGGSFSTTAGVDGVSDNDTDLEDGTPPGGDASLVAPPSYHAGAFTLNNDGSFTYTHDGSENFTDSFTYTVDDSDSGTSNLATVTITIIPGNDAPVAADDDGLGTFWEPYFHVPEFNPPTLIPAAALIDNDSDPEGDPLTIVVASGPTSAGGFVSCDPTGCTYTSPAGNVFDTFTYQVDDGTLVSAPATVTIDVENTEAGLVLTAISAVPNPVTLGSNVTFVTDVVNLGADGTGGVVLSADYPAGTSFFSASSTKGGCSDVGSRVTCSIGNMALFELQTVTVVLTIDTGPGPIMLTPWVTTGSSGDPNPTSNYATHVVGII